MALDYRNAVSILQLAVYAPCFFLALFVSSRHGTRKAAGWILLVFFAVLRMIGSSLQLGTLASQSPGLEIAAAIFEILGILPLIGVCVGLLSRVNDSVKNPKVPLVLKLVTILSIVGGVLSIVGGTNGAAFKYPGSTNTMTQVSVVMFFLTWVGMCNFLLLMLLGYSKVQQGDKRLVIAVAFSAPLIFIRIVYSLICSYANNPDFNFFTGSVTLYLCLAVIEEISVVVACIIAGLGLRVIAQGALGDEAASITGTENSYRKNRGTQCGFERARNFFREGRDTPFNREAANTCCGGARPHQCGRSTTSNLSRTETTTRPDSIHLGRMTRPESPQEQGVEPALPSYEEVGR